MELPTYRIIRDLPLRDVEMFNDDRIADILTRLEGIGFDLRQMPSPLEDLTLRELEMLSRDTNGAN